MTSMEYSTFVKTGSELMHHGVLGQKWGIRRFQPYPEGHKGGQELGEAARRARLQGKLERLKMKTELTEAKNKLANAKQKNEIDEAQAKLQVAQAKAARRARHPGKLERLKMKTELAEAKNKLANAKQKNEIDEAQAKLQVAQAKAAIRNPNTSTQSGNSGQQNQQMRIVANPSSEALKQNVIRSGDPKMLKRYEKMLDNNEFKAAKERIEMRKQLEDKVRKETINRFMDKGETIVNTIKKAGSIASEAKTAYNNAVEIQNKLFPNSKWKKIKDETPLTSEQKQKLIQAIEKQDAFRQRTGFDPLTGKRAKGLYDSQGHFIRFATATEERTGIIVDPNTGISIDVNNTYGPGAPLQMFDTTSFTPTPRPANDASTSSSAPTTTARYRGHTLRLQGIRHDDIYSDELYHHGILGQKWGIRRFQPYRKGEEVRGGKEVGLATKVKQINFTEKIRKGVHEVNKLRNTIQKGKEDKAAHKLRMKQLRDAKAEIGRARHHELMEQLRMRAQEEEDKAREAKREENERRERNVERVRQIAGDIAKAGAAAYGIYNMKKYYDSMKNPVSAVSQVSSIPRPTTPPTNSSSTSGSTSPTPISPTSSGSTTSTTHTLPANVFQAIRNSSGSGTSSASNTTNSPRHRVRDAFSSISNAIQADRSLNRTIRDNADQISISAQHLNDAGNRAGAKSQKIQRAIDVLERRQRAAANEDHRLQTLRNAPNGANLTRNPNTDFSQSDARILASLKDMASKLGRAEVDYRRAAINKEGLSRNLKAKMGRAKPMSNDEMLSNLRTLSTEHTRTLSSALANDVAIPDGNYDNIDAIRRMFGRS